jgi:transposase
MYEPKSQGLKRVRSVISASNWDKRVAQAKELEGKILEVKALVQGGLSLNVAVTKVGGRYRPSTLKRWSCRYGKEGLDGLIDTRTPREMRLGSETKAKIAACYPEHAKLSVEEVAAKLTEEGVSGAPSLSMIKKELRRIDDRRRHAAKKEQETKPRIVELSLAGGELLLAAEMETGVMSALTDEVMAIATEAKEAAGDAKPEKDTALRNRLGKFTAEYNAARARKPGEQIPGYLRSAEEKAKGRVVTWPRFVQEGRESIRRKVETLTLSWGLTETKGWNSLRAKKMAGLEQLTGYAYMPSTLAKMSSALAKSAAGDRFLEAVGTRWHGVASNRWGERGSIAALYVDNHAKEVWSSLYTLSGKVSHLNRVMPCITTTYVHTGAGAPLVASVQSGSAPLASRLQAIVENAEKQLGEEIRRAVIIDAEGSTFDVLESFVKNNANASKSRIIVTPLRPSRAPGLEITHGPGSYFRPYREHDELRIGRATLTHKSSGRSLEIGTLEIRREHRDSDTILLTNGLDLGASGKDLADLYFVRWPLQENAFVID